MANTTYTALFEQAQDSTWTGYIPDLPLVLGTGPTKAAALADLHAALQLWLEDMKARNLPIPPPAAQPVQIEVAA